MNCTTFVDPLRIGSASGGSRIHSMCNIAVFTINCTTFVDLLRIGSASGGSNVHSMCIIAVFTMNCTTFVDPLKHSDNSMSHLFWKSNIFPFTPLCPSGSLAEIGGGRGERTRAITGSTFSWDCLLLCLISSFRRDIDEIWALLGYYAARIGNSLPTFQDYLSVPSWRVKKSKNKAGNARVHSVTGFLLRFLERWKWDL